jgi:hypothetical protein
MDNLIEAVFWPDFHQGMNMIRHYAPSIQGISLAIER